MGIKKSKNVTDKILRETFSDILAGMNSIRKWVAENDIWLTNGYMGAKFPLESFPLNAALINDVDMTQALDGLKEEGYLPAKEDVRKCYPDHHTLVKLTTGSTAAYLNSQYYEMFRECDFWVKDALSPVKVTNHYGVTVGLILPVRVKDNGF